MADAPYKLILLRHGESEWNAKNLFTGWVDVNLTEKGEKEAVRGGELLKDAGLLPDVLHTSLQRRAIRTAQLALESADRLWIPVRRSWRLNERHYGALQGKDKAQTLAEFGEEQFMLWRRSYDTPPPPLARDDEYSQFDDPRYATLPPEVRPDTECLKDVVVRMLPYWFDSIVPDLLTGRTVLVAAHGNSLRGLVKHLDGISDEDISGLNIPTGIPLSYEARRRLQAAEAGRHVPRPGRGEGGHRGREEPGQEEVGSPIMPPTCAYGAGRGHFHDLGPLWDLNAASTGIDSLGPAAPSVDDDSPTLHPHQPHTARPLHLDPVLLHLPGGAVERGPGEVHPDHVVDLQVVRDRATPGMRAAVAGVAHRVDPVRSRRGQRRALADRLDVAARARVGGVCACRSGHCSILSHASPWSSGTAGRVDALGSASCGGRASPVWVSSDGLPCGAARWSR